MIPDYIVQTEENTGKRESIIIKRKLFCSYSLKILSLVFLVLSAALLDYFYLIGFILLYIIGILLRQLVLERIGKFEFFLVNERLELTKISNFLKIKEHVTINIKNIITFEVVTPDNVDKKCFYAIKEGMSIIKIAFFDNNQEKIAFFTPSLYLESIIRKKINDILR